MKSTATISNASYQQMLSQISGQYFGLAIEDPEWGIDAGNPSEKPKAIKQKSGSVLPVKSGDYKKKDWDKTPATEEYFKEIQRVSKNQIVFGANFFPWIVEKTFKPPRRSQFQHFLKKHPVGWILWDKMNGKSDQWDCELAWTSFDRPSVVYQFMWSGMFQGSKSDGTVMEGDKSLNEKRIHPCHKPTSLYKWILRNYADQSDTILDSHAGSFPVYSHVPIWALTW